MIMPNTYMQIYDKLGLYQIMNEPVIVLCVFSLILSLTSIFMCLYLMEKKGE